MDLNKAYMLLCLEEKLRGHPNLKPMYDSVIDQLRAMSADEGVAEQPPSGGNEPYGGDGEKVEKLDRRI